MIISCIVPFYNVEKYIAKCLDSLINQDMLDYEIICVNDCTQDSSRDIVLQYSQKYPNIRLIDHLVNKKVGGARNTGLLNAKGDYVWFIDSDDFIPDNVLNKLVGICKDDDLEVLAFNIMTVANDGALLTKETAFAEKTDKVYRGTHLLEDTFYDQLIFNMGYPYRAIFRRTFLLDIRASFPENISYGEDTVFMTRALMYASRSKSLVDPFYCYRQNANSITTQLEQNFNGRIVYQSIICAGNYIQNLIDEFNENETTVSESIRVGMPWFVNRLTSRLVKAEYKERVVFFDLCKSNSVYTDIIYSYSNKINRFILKYPLIANWLIIILRPIYLFKLRVS